MVQYASSLSDNISSLDASPRPMKRLKREMPSTPARNFLNVSVAGHSPAVAVRLIVFSSFVSLHFVLFIVGSSEWQQAVTNTEIN